MLEISHDRKKKKVNPITVYLQFAKFAAPYLPVLLQEAYSFYTTGPARPSWTLSQQLVFKIIKVFKY